MDFYSNFGKNIVYRETADRYGWERQESDFRHAKHNEVQKRRRFGNVVFVGTEFDPCSALSATNSDRKRLGSLGKKTRTQNETR